MKRFTLALALLAGATLTGCVVVPAPPYATAYPYGADAAPVEVYPAYVAPFSFGLYYGWPYGYDAPGYRYDRGGRYGPRRGHRGGR